MPGKAPAEAEGDTNLSPRRQAWAEAHLDEPARDLVRRDAAGVLASVRLHALPVGHPPRRGDLDRGHAGPAVHGFPRQQRPPRRLRPSPADRGDPASARRAVVRAPAIHLRAGRRAGREARGDRAGESEQGPLRPQRLGRHRDGPRLRPRGDRPVQDDLVLGLVPRGRLRGAERGGRGHVPERADRPLARPGRSTCPPSATIATPGASPRGVRNCAPGQSGTF